MGYFLLNIYILREQKYVKQVLRGFVVFFSAVLMLTVTFCELMWVGGLDKVKCEVTVLRLRRWCERPSQQDITAETIWCLCHKPVASGTCGFD